MIVIATGKQNGVDPLGPATPYLLEVSPLWLGAIRHAHGTGHLPRPVFLGQMVLRKGQGWPRFRHRWRPWIIDGHLRCRITDPATPGGPFWPAIPAGRAGMDCSSAFASTVILPAQRNSGC